MQGVKVRRVPHTSGLAHLCIITEEAGGWSTLASPLPRLPHPSRFSKGEHYGRWRYVTSCPSVTSIQGVVLPLQRHRKGTIRQESGSSRCKNPTRYRIVVPTLARSARMGQPQFW